MPVNNFHYPTLTLSLSTTRIFGFKVVSGEAGGRCKFLPLDLFNKFIYCALIVEISI